MIELLSPAGSPEAVIAAVQNGADAIYMGLGNFNARRGALLPNPRLQGVCHAQYLGQRP